MFFVTDAFFIKILIPLPFDACGITLRISDYLVFFFVTAPVTILDNVEQLGFCSLASFLTKLGGELLAFCISKIFFQIFPSQSRNDHGPVTQQQSCTCWETSSRLFGERWIAFPSDTGRISLDLENRSYRTVHGLESENLANRH